MVDKHGDTIDFYLSRTRNAKAAKRFLGKAVKGRKDWEMPRVINTDKAGCYGVAIAELKKGQARPWRYQEGVTGEVRLIERIFGLAAV